MTRRLLTSCLAATSLFALALPALAHHGDAGRYEDKITTLTGTVVAVQLVNPHSLIVLDVKDEDGKTTRWRAEMGSPRGLATQFGWDRNTLKPGDKITITGRRIKSGAPYFNLTERAQIRMTDTGKEIYRSRNYQPQSPETAAND
jgi:hypothetical protein